ncbi:ATP-dependent DNA helicase RecQ [Enterococcus sp. BWM-S5]|uniref:ATP-dependent DNA helicase RecQ n=1 Tax=Enterococcus larvae TaxID=2794352 RepID=A0ABS4CGT3_9ENTE|nr:ATP-dependent DNA helicase RecQ [Enterococcus larvae]MBP1045650.1 ATP-dependent DNA helicase RecQ [Enterococcus larvae]
MDLKKILLDHFGYSSFREGQQEIIEALLSNKDTLAVLPTGTGKSLTYQFAGKVLSGSVLVVSPLLSLMEDQVRQLQKQGERRVIAFNSFLSYDEKQYILTHLHTYKFIFISPESLMKEAVLSKLQEMNLSLFVIDEAHCVSQWGVDFRPEYVKIKDVLQKLDFPLTLALTATASASVENEIKEYLFKEPANVCVFVYSVNRKNLVLAVEQTQEKEQRLFDYLAVMNRKGIVYCTARKTTEMLCRKVRMQTSLRVAFYHGGLSAGERNKIQQQFIDNDLDVLFATNAFGMGIDKPDIRFVVHYDCPASLENYVQEIGRAGRDGLSAKAVLLYRDGDEIIHRFFRDEVKEDLNALQRLIEGHSEFSPELIESMSEIQQKWLQGYLDGSYTLETLNERLQKKDQEKYYQLEQMLEYIHTNTCRRGFIMNYFSEEPLTEKEELCCDNCGSVAEIMIESEKTVEMPEESWQEILIRLFKDKK